MLRYAILTIMFTVFAQAQYTETLDVLVNLAAGADTEIGAIPRKSVITDVWIMADTAHANVDTVHVLLDSTIWQSVVYTQAEGTAWHITPMHSVGLTGVIAYLSVVGESPVGRLRARIRYELLH